jgi:hypothetical protein
MELKKNFTEQIKNEENIKIQCEKYRIIKKKAFITMNNKLGILNDLRSYENMSNIKFEIAIHKKKQIFEKLKEQAKELTQETEDMGKQYELIKKEIKIITQLIKENDQIHIKQRNEISSFLSEIIKDKYYITKILDSLKVKEISDIINIFSQRKYLSNNLQMQIQYFNKELKLRNFELRKYKKEVDYIEKYIYEKRSQTQIQECESDFESINLEAKLNIKRKNNINFKEKLCEYEDFINKICNKFFQHGLKLNDILNYIHKFSYEKDIKKKKIKTLNQNDEPFNELDDIYSLKNNLMDYHENINEENKNENNEYNNNYIDNKYDNNYMKMNKKDQVFFEYSDNLGENIRKSKIFLLKYIL